MGKVQILRVCTEYRVLDVDSVIIGLVPSFPLLFVSPHAIFKDIWCVYGVWSTEYVQDDESAMSASNAN